MLKTKQRQWLNALTFRDEPFPGILFVTAWYKWWSTAKTILVPPFQFLATRLKCVDGGYIR